jgi:hypothetical protein
MNFRVWEQQELHNRASDYKLPKDSRQLTGDAQYNTLLQSCSKQIRAFAYNDKAHFHTSTKPTYLLLMTNCVPVLPHFQCHATSPQRSVFENYVKNIKSIILWKHSSTTHTTQCIVKNTVVDTRNTYFNVENTVVTTYSTYFTLKLQ